ncbi:uncharacterized protein DFL_007883 [Arthrobotrys flagrans]|uniref:Methyltransferase domain-containing protein n=1 Tax=Arthrobotrys flagrans TaxID=97331 RepID=A0A436ZXM5_ARTFL|nr:hypothetical protein DFL_007883 [Arthrobotrys flagrans]
MRICILRAAPGQGDDTHYSDIGLFTDRHTFEQRFINKDTIKPDLNLAAAENFDLYFNFLHWAWHGSTHKAAAVLAAKYIEYLAIPVIGLPIRILERCDLDTFGRFMLENVDIDIGQLQEENLMVGQEYSCTTIELDNTPIPLSPVPQIDTGVLSKLASRISSPSNSSLFNTIQKLAEDAFYANDLHGSFWCTFHFRVTVDAKPVLAGINPMPKTIFPFTSAPEACAVRESFPGSYRSLMQSLIASYFLKRNRNFEVFRKIGEEYDEVAPIYDDVTKGVYYDGVNTILKKYNFDGIVLDVACGTGLVARLHGNPHNLSRFIGMELSSQMRTECVRHGLYSTVLVGPMQRLLITYKDPVDHIICMGAFHFLDTNELSLVLSRAFQLARRSVTFTIDEIPNSYKKAQSTRGREYMAGFNHLDEVERYGTPVGWKLADRWRYLGWASPTTGDEVYSNVFRFEAL